MTRFSILYKITFLSFLFVMGCNSTPSSPGTAKIIKENNKDYIVDFTGKKWDVSQAMETYGMEPSKFQYGLGPFAIKPILTPKMLSPGEVGYPDDDEEFLILGTKLNGATRAYPISIMSWVEIADEKFGNLHVAVAY